MFFFLPWPIFLLPRFLPIPIFFLPIRAERFNFFLPIPIFFCRGRRWGRKKNPWPRHLRKTLIFFQKASKMPKKSGGSRVGAPPPPPPSPDFFCSSGRKSWTNRKKQHFQLSTFHSPNLSKYLIQGFGVGSGAQWQSSGCVGGEAVHRHMGASFHDGRVTLETNKIQIFDFRIVGGLLLVMVSGGSRGGGGPPPIFFSGFYFFFVHHAVVHRFIAIVNYYCSFFAILWHLQRKY